MSFFKSKKSYILLAVAIIVILQIVGKTLNYYRKSTATPDPFAILADPDFNRRLDAAYDIALNDGDYSTTFTTSEQFQNELLPVAEMGYTKAESVVGDLYSIGYLTEQSKEKSLYWLEKAANKGDLGASLSLGNMYYEGTFLEQNYQKAIHWYKNNAEAGNQSVQCLIGGIYFSGLGNVKKDYKEAFKWLKLSADQGTPQAQMLLGELYLFGWGIEKNYNLAKKLFELSSNENIGYAYFFLGYIYDAGLGIPEDKPHAIILYKQASKLGNKEAQKRLHQLSDLKP